MEVTRRTTGSSADAREKAAGADKDGAKVDEACRCKETAQMTPRELITLMVKDLAFWKRPKKD